MIKLYLYRLGGFLSKAALASKAERNKLISKTAYNLMLEKLYEITGVSQIIRKTPKGKPYPEDSSYNISISHCDEAIFFAISDSDIGVDIEMEREFSLHAEKRLFSDNERIFISSGDKKRRSIILWTLREAVCKATGEGFSEWFFNCSFADDFGKIAEKYENLNLKVFEKEDFICTVAAESDLKDIEFIDITL